MRKSRRIRDDARAIELALTDDTRLTLAIAEFLAIDPADKGLTRLADAIRDESHRAHARYN